MVPHSIRKISSDSQVTVRCGDEAVGVGQPPGLGATLKGPHTLLPGGSPAPLRNSVEPGCNNPFDPPGARRA